MLDFQLPRLQGNITITDALMEATDQNSSGVLYEPTPGEYRLVHVYSMIQAAINKETSLESVFYEPVVDTQTFADSLMPAQVQQAHQKFGFRGLWGTTDMARLFSLSEGDGRRYEGRSPARRCTRPGIPPNTEPRKWFHYPPVNYDPADPNHCAVCTAPLQ